MQAFFGDTEHYPPVIHFPGTTDVYDTITGSIVRSDDLRYTLLHESRKQLVPKFVTILDPFRLEQFNKYGEWIVVNKQKFNAIWTK